MKPVVILPKGQMTKEDITELRANDWCVVECDDPSLVRFTEPPPASYSNMDQAAMKLCRYLVDCDRAETVRNRRDIAALLVEFILEGESLPPPQSLKQIAKAKKK